MLAGSAAGGGVPAGSGVGVGGTGSLTGVPGAAPVCAGPPGVLGVGRVGSMNGRSTSGVVGAAVSVGGAAGEGGTGVGSGAAARAGAVTGADVALTG